MQCAHMCLVSHVAVVSLGMVEAAVEVVMDMVVLDALAVTQFQ